MDSTYTLDPDSPLFPSSSTRKSIFHNSGHASALTYTILEQAPHARKFKCLLRAQSKARKLWDALIMLLAVWNCFYIPFQVAFIQGTNYLTFVVFDVVIDVAFVLDIVLYARTTYFDSNSGQEVTDSVLILRNYALSGKLAIDVFSAVPFDIVSLLTSEHRALQFFTMLKVARLLRLSKIIMFAQRNSSAKLRLQLLKLFFLFVIFLHVAACLWYLVTSNSEDSSNENLDSLEQEVLRDSTWVLMKYAFSLYVAITKADLGPKTEGELIFMGAMLLVIQMFQAYMFGEIFVSLYNLNRKSRVVTSIQNAAATTMIHMKLDHALRAKISAFLVSGQGSLTKQTEFDNLFKALPPSLRQEVRSYIFEEITVRNPVLAAGKQLAVMVLRRVRNLFCQPDQVVITQGEAPDGVYFVAEGKFAVWVFDETKTQHKVKNLTTGAHFGEVALLYPTNRTATVISSHFSNLAMLPKDDFYSVLRRFPQAYKLFKDSAIKYNDRWKRFMIKTLQKCPMFQHLPASVLCEVLYRLPVSRVEGNTYIYKVGEVANKITFVIGGSVEVYAPVNDSRLQSFGTKFNFTREQTELASRLRFHRESLLFLKQKRDMRFLVKVGIDELGMGSVLCPNVTLLGEKVDIFAKTVQTTIVMTLTGEMLEALAQDSKPIQRELSKHKSSLLLNTRFSRVRRYQMTALDYYKGFPPDTPEAEIRKWEAKMKVRRCALGKLLEQRVMRAKGFPNLFVLSRKLRAILEAEKNEDFEMAEKVRLGVVPVTDRMSEALKLLQMSEVENPMLTQFAIEAVQAADSVSRLLLTAAGVRERVKSLEKERFRLSRQMHKVQQLVSLYSRLYSLQSQPAPTP